MLITQFQCFEYVYGGQSSRNESFNAPVLSRGVSVRNLKLAAIVDLVVLDAQEQSGSVDALDLPDAGSSGSRSPLLVGSTSLVPLDDLRPAGLLLLGDVDALAVEDALQQPSGSLLHPSPSLVEPLVLLVLDEALTVLESSPRDVDSLAGVAVNQDAGLVKGGRVVYWNNIEELTEDVRIELFVPEDSLQGHSFGSLGGSLEPEGVVLVLLHLEELVAAHLAGPQADLGSFFVPDEVGLAVDDLILVFAVTDLLDHPQLGEFVVVGGGADNAGLVVFFGVVGLDLEGLISILADDLIDVSSGELERLHRIFGTFINIQTTVCYLLFDLDDVTQLKKGKGSRGSSQVGHRLVLIKITVTSWKLGRFFQKKEPCIEVDQSHLSSIRRQGMFK